MRVWISTFFVLSSLYAADPQQIALVAKAEADFTRVQLSATPPLADATACVQSMAAVLSVSPPEDAAQLYFRRGYCILAGATITGSAQEYLAAAVDFNRAIDAWPARVRRQQAKKQPVETVPGALRVLPVIAQLHAGTDTSMRAGARTEIQAALAEPSCGTSLLLSDQCDRIVKTGREWLGWFALAENQLEEAAKQFAGTGDNGWSDWVEGQRQFRAGNYLEAVTREERAIIVWKSASPRRLGPAPDLPTALSDLGGAQLLAGNPRGAIITLDSAIKAQPNSPQALYRRARAHELAGEPDAALADYGLASRVAFAGATDLASGEAHLYRGIVQYRRKNFERAEDEFASALNFEIPAILRADAQAWRHMAAVASGSCASAKEFLDRTLPGVSPYFPKQEAQQIASRCGTQANNGGH